MATLTESIQSRSSDHEQVTFDLVDRLPALIGQMIRSHEHSEAADTDQDALT
jgi:hypothetical protein